MIESIEINNYKNYKDVLVPLTRVSLLGGRNNVGKTNFLEALFMLHDKFNPEMILRHFGARGLNELAMEPDIMWGPIFRDYNMEKEISISVMKNGRKETMKILYNPNRTKSSIPVQPVSPGVVPQIRTNQKATVAYELELSYKIQGEREQKWRLFFNPQGMGVHVENGTLGGPRAVILSSSNRVNPNEDATRFGELDIQGKQDLVIKFLKVFEPRLKGISTITNGRDSLIYGDIGLGRKIPISFMGDGITRLLSIILAILTSKDGVVLIDEIENGIHYTVMPKVWGGIARAARETNVQVVATTHSYECLKAALEGFTGEFEGDFSYTRLERHNAQIISKSFDYSKLSIALDNEWEVR